jgi:hypothetical protein
MRAEESLPCRDVNGQVAGALALCALAAKVCELSGDWTNCKCCYDVVLRDVLSAGVDDVLGRVRADKGRVLQQRPVQLKSGFQCSTGKR